MQQTAIYAGIILVALLVFGLIVTRLYRRSTKELTYVRTGFGGMKVIMDGGALVFPVLHEVMPVNMNTQPILVAKGNEESINTADKLRVNISAEFYIRVKPDREAIGIAAQTLGRRTQTPDALKALIQGKLVDALRAVASKMTMEDLLVNRTGFVQEVQKIASHELSMNGLELESVSLLSLNQTDRAYFSEDNAFDAEGLTILTRQIQLRKRERNEIEQGTAVEIAERNRSANLEQLEIRRKDREATLQQEQEIALLEASQAATIATRQAEQLRESEQARISSEQAIQVAETEQARAVEVAGISRERAVQEATIEREKGVELAKQQRDIAVANASRDQSKAQAEAAAAEEDAVKARQQVVTAEAEAEAERQRRIAVIAATREAEVAATGITVAAEAEKRAAQDRAEAARELARGQADAALVAAEAGVKAKLLEADAAERTYAVDAEGQNKLNEAANRLDQRVLSQRVSLATIEALPDIIRESVRPMESIDSIKIIDVGGLGGGNQQFGPGGEALISGGNLAEDAVRAGLRFRSQAPLVDALLGEVLGRGVTLDSLVTSGADRATRRESVAAD